MNTKHQFVSLALNAGLNAIFRKSFGKIKLLIVWLISNSTKVSELEII